MIRKKKVIISITDKHGIDGVSEAAEMTTVGTLTGSGDNYALEYREQDEEMKNSVTTLRVENKSRVLVTRRGDYPTQLVIEKDKRHNCHYSTPIGEMMMGVFAREITSRMTPGGGELKMNFTIDFNSGMVSVNEMKITVREA